MKIIIGIDEVGRGPLAGPVTMCVVACEAKLYVKLKKDLRLPLAGFDSKKLKPVERQSYAKILKSLVSKMPFDTLVRHSGLIFVVMHVSNKIIDARGISFAITKAITRALVILQKQLKFDPADCHVLLDGGLKAPVEFIHQKTIIKGDEKEKIIAWASILAKVSRDALMTRASKKFPQYEFEKHKGYGTARHRDAINKYGFSPIHRKTFCSSIFRNRRKYT